MPHFIGSSTKLIELIIIFYFFCLMTSDYLFYHSMHLFLMPGNERGRIRAKPVLDSAPTDLARTDNTNICWHNNRFSLRLCYHYVNDKSCNCIRDWNPGPSVCGPAI